MKQTLFLLLLCSSLSAQGLLKDKAFFEQQSQTYQQWLEDTGLGQVLRVQDIIIKADELLLYLTFHTEDSDQCWAEWEQLQLDFEQQNMLQLERKLFYQLITIMDVRQSVANIQIYDTYDLSKEPCFVVQIYHEKGAFKVNEEDCRNAIREITIRPNDLSGGKQLSAATFHKTYNKKKVFEALLEYSVAKYEGQVITDRKPEVEVLNYEEVLCLRVKDLSNVVLPDSHPVWQRFLGVNWTKRERLTIIISYERITNGLKIGIDVEGKYGSGFFNDVGLKGYHSMDGDFKEELEAYADKLKEEYREVIKNL